MWRDSLTKSGLQPLVGEVSILTREKKGRMTIKRQALWVPLEERRRQSGREETRSYNRCPRNARIAATNNVAIDIVAVVGAELRPPPVEVDAVQVAPENPVAHGHETSGQMDDGAVEEDIRANEFKNARTDAPSALLKPKLNTVLTS